MDQQTFLAPQKSNDTYFSPRLMHKVLSKGLPLLAIECLDVHFCLADAGKPRLRPLNDLQSPFVISMYNVVDPEIYGAIGVLLPPISAKR